MRKNDGRLRTLEALLEALRESLEGRSHRRHHIQQQDEGSLEEQGTQDLDALDELAQVEDWVKREKWADIPLDELAEWTDEVARYSFRAEVA